MKQWPEPKVPAIFIAKKAKIPILFIELHKTEVAYDKV